MAILSENEIKDKTMLEIASQMAVSARTAPKGRGVNNVEIKTRVKCDLFHAHTAEAFRRPSIPSPLLNALNAFDFPFISCIISSNKVSEVPLVNPKDGGKHETQKASGSMAPSRFSRNISYPRFEC
jgi:hypothetical protein